MTDDDTPTDDAQSALDDGAVHQTADGDVPVHDHSGPDAGGTTLHPTDVATAQTPRVDVRRYGVVGDGETDDSAPFQAAVDAATPRGVLYVPPSLDVYLASGVEADCGADDEALREGTAAATPFAIDCKGTIRPAPGIGDAIHLHHAVQPYVNVRVQGGGEGPDADSAVHVTDALGGVYEGFASGYDGTVLTFTRGETRLSGVEVGVLRASHVGRELLMRGPADGMLGEEGGVGTVEDVWGYPRVGMEFHRVRGLKVDQYENVVVSGFTTRGNRFVDCENVSIDKFAVGGNADIDTLVEFSDCRHVSVGAVFAHAAPSNGVTIDGVRHGSFDRLFVNNAGEVGVEYVQTGDQAAADNEVVVDSRGTAGTPLLVGENVSGANHYFSGSYTGDSAPATVESSDATRVVFHDATLKGASVDGPGLALPADNDVYVYDALVKNVDANPKLFNGVGQAEGSAEHPDAGAWPLGAVVEYTDTDDGSGTGLYQLFPSGWRQLATEPADLEGGAGDTTSAPTSTPTPTSGAGSTPTDTAAPTTDSSAGGGLPGFDVGTGLVALAGAALTAAKYADGGDGGGSD